MGAAERLYTPELLGLAVALAQWPPMASASARGEARSATCGSTLALDLMLDPQGRIEGLGMRVRACAVGQAAAAIFAAEAIGCEQADIAATLEGLEAWLAGEAALPDWPGLATLAPAREFPGRHGAMLLPWRAATAALSSAPAHG